MRFDFRKIASAAASAAMLGSTVALAAAVSYPAPFVQSGAGDVAVVYGSNLDLSAVTEISNSLNAAMVNDDSSSSTGDPVGGEFIKLSKSSNNINVGNEISGVFGVTVNDDDLPTLLADGVYRNDENTEFDYEQKVTLATNFVLAFFADNDYNDKVPTVGINFTNNKDVFNYTLDFTDNAESDVSGGDLVDLETTDIVMMGRNYFIFDVDNSTSKFTLLDSANSGIVSEGETVTVSAGANSYQVSINFISETSAKLSINGEVTNSMAVGETYRLSDNSYVGIKEVNKLAVAGELGTVEFSIGAGKLELPNNDNIELNDVQVNEVKSRITRGTTSGGKETIDKITINWKTDDDEFITPDNDLMMPGFEVLKFSMNDIVIPAEEVMRIRDAGSTRIVLDAEIEDGLVTLPLFYTNGTGDFVGLGDDSDELTVTTFETAIEFNKTRNDAHLVVSWNSSTEGETYIVRASGWNTDGPNNRTTIQKLTESGWEEVEKNVKSGDTVDFGSASLTVASVSRDDAINFTAGSGVSFHKLFTREGLFVQLPYIPISHTPASGSINFTNGTANHGYNTFLLNFHEEDKDDNLGSGATGLPTGSSANFSVVLGQNSDNEPQVSSYATGTQQHKEVENDNNLVSRTKSDLATKVRRIGASSDQREAEVTYSGGEVYAEVFLTDVSTSSSGGGELGGISVMDTELASSGMQTKNLIAVGGTCVNDVASTLLGVSPSTCGDDWTKATGSGSGSWIVQTFANPWSGSKVATLVAGWAQGDTVNAATAFRTLDTIDIAAGKKYTGTTATSATMVA
jgi:hypothetical protein